MQNQIPVVKRPASGISTSSYPYSEELTRGKYSGADAPLTAPWVAMPDGGFPFSANGTINTPDIDVGVWVDVIGPNGQNQFFVPNGNDGVINLVVCFYNGIGFVSGSGSLIWRILQNGQAVRNYDNILVQLGVTPFPANTQIRISSADNIQFQIQNVNIGGMGTQISCFMGGWFYPNKLS